jgi:hypothetical protein
MYGRLFFSRTPYSSFRKPGALNNYVLTAAQGSYTLTGKAAGLLHGYLPLTATKGVYTLSGLAAGLYHGYPLTATKGVYSLGGIAAGLRKTSILTATKGVYTLTGIAAGLAKQRPMAAATGAYALTGVAANFRYFHLSAAKGTYALSGVSANLFPTQPLNVDKLSAYKAANAPVIPGSDVRFFSAETRKIADALETHREVMRKLELRLKAIGG